MNAPAAGSSAQNTLREHGFNARAWFRDDVIRLI